MALKTANGLTFMLNGSRKSVNKNAAAKNSVID